MQMNTRMLLYTDALECWGAESQISLFYEEIGEVLTAISHEKRGRCDKAAVLEELVDLQIMLNQMVVLYGTDEAFNNIFNVKLHRLINRIGIER